MSQKSSARQSHQNGPKALTGDRLRAPLDLVLVRKIGAPGQPELAMGAIAEGEPPAIVRNEDVIRALGIDRLRFDAMKMKALEEIAERRRRYIGQRPRAEIAGRIAIVIDDGVATGATTRAALRSVRAQRPRQLILAVPVAPASLLEVLRLEADRVVCLEAPHDLYAVGIHYRKFDQTSDSEVIEMLARDPATRVVAHPGKGET
ncbi:phosphoribosyltransferase [Minwuia thermotolerans]|uniref:Phosphoribosyltransferase n=1 Tax=Minwuia thermotolerans TaxID=2056226 RepID=A0A2M9G3T0_9PROT|nr:phosphoribosyltransferase family protein [Minwuia thermotolerans]PJK30336.1 phosphoribosyltransferase [Minwuia thermotolerans]